jgi:polyketide biosynthesis acyl carrier protein
MPRDQIFGLLKQHIVRVLPSVPPERIVPHASLKELGADSVDRADIATSLKDDLGVNLPLVELGKVKDLAGLVDLLHGLASERA